MASTASNEDRAADFTEAVVGLQSVVRNFQEDIRNGRSDFVLTPMDPVGFLISHRVRTAN